MALAVHVDGEPVPAHPPVDVDLRPLTHCQRRVEPVSRPARPLIRTPSTTLNTGADLPGLRLSKSTGSGFLGQRSAA
jgi:hypothetical protein